MIDTRLVVDSAMASPRVAHEQNVIGTMNILAACGGPDSPVRKVIFKSSAHYYGCERDDPSFFAEHMRRPHEPRTRLESDIVEADDAVQGFAERNNDVTVTTLRFCNGLGSDLRTSHIALLSLPAVPGILGFDPRYQFIHEDDIVGALHHAALNDLPGIYNAAPDGVLALSEIASLLGKPYLPAAAAVGHRARHPRDGTARHPRPRRGAPAAALRTRPRQPQAQAVRLPLQPHHPRGRAGVRGGAAAGAAAGERRRAISLRARSRGIPALVARTCGAKAK